MQDNNDYLPTIDPTTTEMSTVYAVPNQSINIMRCLQLSKIGYVSVQKLNSKAVEIIRMGCGATELY